MISEQWVGTAGAIIATLTCVALYIEARGFSPQKLRRPVAGALMLASVVTYFHCFQVPTSAFYHRWEMFHYFLGSKYAAELSYDRLYACAALAEAETSARDREHVAHRRMRDLRTDAIVSASAALREPAACKGHFTPPRWQAFAADVRFFRHDAGPHTWERMQLDHGYNPAPAWTLVGRALSSRAPASRAFLRLLALIDPVFMVGALAVLAWAFGGRVAWQIGRAHV